LKYIGFGSKADRARLTEKEDCDYLLLINAGDDYLYIKHLDGINRIDDGGNIIWETEAIKETAKLENVTKLSAVKKLAERQ